MSGQERPAGPPERRTHKQVPRRRLEDEPPPVLGTWPRVYTFALCELAVVIGLFYWFTIAFQP